MPKKKVQYYGKKKNIIKSTPLYTIVEESDIDLDLDYQEVIHLDHYPSIIVVLPELDFRHNHENQHVDILGESHFCCIIS